MKGPRRVWHRLALDGSLSKRRYDANGYMHVESPFTKVQVAEYRGDEIPGWEGLGLDPERIYSVYRPEDELEKAADTFNGLPLQLLHHPDSPENPQKPHWIGSVGTSARFEYPYLYNILNINDAIGIEAVESGRYRELSAAYTYEPDPTPGEFEGKKYDLVMRNLQGNHVALVEEGRAGPDVVVADARSIKTATKERSMSVWSSIIEAAQNLLGVATAAAAVEAGGAAPGAVPDAEAQVPDEEVKADQGAPPEAAPADGDPVAAAKSWLDAQPDQAGAQAVWALLAALSEPPAADAAKDGDPEKAADVEPEAARDGDPEKAEDGDPEKAEDEGKNGAPFAQDRVRERLAQAVQARGAGKAAVRPQAADAASITVAVERRLAKSFADKTRAAEACRPFLGRVDIMAFDSAGDIYRKALKQAGVRTAVADTEALRAMVQMKAAMKEQGSGAFVAADAAPGRAIPGLADIALGRMN